MGSTAHATVEQCRMAFNAVQATGVLAIHNTSGYSCLAQDVQCACASKPPTFSCAASWCPTPNTTVKGVDTSRFVV